MSSDKDTLSEAEIERRMETGLGRGEGVARDDDSSRGDDGAGAARHRRRPRPDAVVIPRSGGGDAEGAGGGAVPELDRAVLGLDADVAGELARLRIDVDIVVVAAGADRVRAPRDARLPALRRHQMLDRGRRLAESVGIISSLAVEEPGVRRRGRNLEGAVGGAAIAFERVVGGSARQRVVGRKQRADKGRDGGRTERGRNCKG